MISTTLIIHQMVSIKIKLFKVLKFQSLYMQRLIARRYLVGRVMPKDNRDFYNIGFYCKKK